MKKLLTTFFLMSIMLVAPFARADYQIVHTPPSAQELPAPGRNMTLSVTLPKEALSVGVKVRALVTRDGRLMELQDSDPTIDTSDRAIYKLELPSPLAEMSYQFIFTDKLGASFGSQQYQVARKCVPDVQLTTVKKQAPNSQVTKEDAVRLVAESTGLQRDIDSYESIVAILNDIHQVVDKK